MLRETGIRAALLSIIYLLLAWPAFAGEVSLLGGYGWENKSAQHTYAWQTQYMEGLGEHLAYTLSYLNQGHFNEHHRDGYTANLWARTNLLDRRLSLGAGVGGLFYFDTAYSANSGTPQNNHGWGIMTNAAATWYTENCWYYQLQSYWVKGDRSFDTLTVLAGIGYQLDAPLSQGPDVRGTRLTEKTTDNEITVLVGETIVNIPGHVHSSAVAVEYRYGLWRYLDWTAGARYEGENSLTDRHGLTTQLWLAKPFLDDRIALSAGFGGYFALDGRSRDQDRNSDVLIAEIASMSGSLRLSGHWQVRATWDRIITSNDRDSDNIMGGIGYRF